MAATGYIELIVIAWEGKQLGRSGYFHWTQASHECELSMELLCLIEVCREETENTCNLVDKIGTEHMIEAVVGG